MNIKLTSIYNLQIWPISYKFSGSINIKTSRHLYSTILCSEI